MASVLRHRHVPTEASESEPSATAQLVQQLKRLDVYPKTEEENVAVQTSTGGTITILTAIVVFILFLSELSSFLSVTSTHSIAVDHTSAQRMNITFNISFPALRCSKAGIDLMDVSGEQQSDALRLVWKTRLSPAGVALAPPFQDLHEEGEQEEQDHEHAHDDKHADQEDEGCNISGQMSVNKVAGNFHVAIGASHSATPQQRHAHGFSIEEMIGFNSSHIIHKLRFGPDLHLPDLTHPLDGAGEIIRRGNAAAHFQYFVKVVPTLYTNLYNETIETNHYSVTNHTQVLTSMDIFRPDGRRIPGVFFVYDISPFLLRVRDKSTRFTQFAISCCAIVGGIVSIAGIIDSIIHYSEKMIKQ